MNKKNVPQKNVRMSAKRKGIIAAMIAVFVVATAVDIWRAATCESRCTEQFTGQRQKQEEERKKRSPYEIGMEIPPVEIDIESTCQVQCDKGEWLKFKINAYPFLAFVYVESLLATLLAKDIHENKKQNRMSISRVRWAVVCIVLPIIVTALTFALLWLIFS